MEKPRLPGCNNLTERIAAGITALFYGRNFSSA
jgi:hypothetical protein